MASKRHSPTSAGNTSYEELELSAVDRPQPSSRARSPSLVIFDADRMSNSRGTTPSSSHDGDDEYRFHDASDIDHTFAVEVDAAPARRFTRPRSSLHRVLAMFAAMAYVLLMLPTGWGDHPARMPRSQKSAEYLRDVLRDLSPPAKLELPVAPSLSFTLESSKSKNGVFFSLQQQGRTEHFVAISAKTEADGVQVFDVDSQECIWTSHFGRVPVLTGFQTTAGNRTTQYLAAWSAVTLQLHVFSAIPTTDGKSAKMSQVATANVSSDAISSLCAGTQGNVTHIFLSGKGGRSYVYTWDGVQDKLVQSHLTFLPLSPGEKVGDCAIAHRFGRPETLLVTSFGNLLSVSFGSLDSAASKESVYTVDVLMRAEDPLSDLLSDAHVELSASLATISRDKGKAPLTAIALASLPMSDAQLGAQTDTACQLQLLIAYTPSSSGSGKRADGAKGSKSGQFFILYRPSCYDDGAVPDLNDTAVHIYSFVRQWRYLTAFSLPRVSGKINGLRLRHPPGADNSTELSMGLTATLDGDDNASASVFNLTQLVRSELSLYNYTAAAQSLAVGPDDALRNAMRDEIASYACSVASCSSHGLCQDRTPGSPAPECQCFDGYTGVACQEFSCALVDNCGDSQSRGSCIGPNTCDCRAPYTGLTCLYNAATTHAANLTLAPSQALSNHTAGDNDDPEVYVHPTNPLNHSVVLGTTKSDQGDGGLHMWQLGPASNGTQVGREIWFEQLPTGSGANSVDVMYNISVLDRDGAQVGQVDLVVAGVRGSINGLGVWAIDAESISYNAELNNITSASDVRPALAPLTNITYSSNLTADQSALPELESVLPAQHSVLELNVDRLEVYGSCVSNTERQPDNETLQTVYMTTKKGYVHEFALQVTTDVTNATGYMAHGLQLHVQERTRWPVGFRSQLENCVVDDTMQTLFIGEEGVGLWAYPLNTTSSTPECDPRQVLPLLDFEDAGTRRFAYPFAASPLDVVDEQQACPVWAAGHLLRPVLVDTTYTINPAGRMVADVEGVSIYRTANSSGFIIVSVQGANAYNLYERQHPWRFVAAIRIPGSADDPQMDEVTNTDSLVVSSQPMGPFAHGVLVVHDDVTTRPTEHSPFQALDVATFKVVDWASIALVLADAVPHS